jgi:hypothetical protein
VDFDEEEFWRKYKEGRKLYEGRQLQIVPAFINASLDGFRSEADSFVIGEDLKIFRLTSREREEFHKRAASLSLDRSLNMNNEHFIRFDYESTVGAIGGMSTGDKITLISIFFAVCCKGDVNVNKAQCFGFLKGSKRL